MALAVSISYFALFQFAIGAILLWLVLNFGILKAILTHAGWNISMMLIMLFWLQYPDKILNTFETEQVKVEWKRVPRFESYTIQIKQIHEDTLLAENVEARFLYKYLSSPEQLDSIQDYRILQQENYMRYNFMVVNKAGKSSLAQTCKDFLLEEKLVYLSEK